MISIGRFYTKSIALPDEEIEEDEEGRREAPLVGVNIHVELIDYCAQVTQTQRFRNNEKSPLEASYEFLLPKGCAVSSFSADVGDRHLTGTVQDKQKAENKYDDALAAGHSAALLTSKEEEPNTFVLQLGNVAPGTEAFVTITYERLAALTDDKIVLTLDGSDARSVIFADPPAKTPENDARVEPGFHFNVHVATQTPLKSVSSPSHPIVVELTGDGASVRLAEGADWRESKNFVLEAAVADPHRPSVRMQKNDKAEVAMLSFYPTIDTRQTKCEMIFVLDRSGSMSGRAIECAKATLQFFLRSLPEDAYFNIVSFGSRFECFKPESVPFNDDTLEQATEHMNGFKANLGGTNIYYPLESIFKQPPKPGYPRQVFILTDGEVEDKDECIELVKRNANTTRLFAFGIGSSVDEGLVKGMARAGEGSSSIIRDNSNIREGVMKQLDLALQPGLTDIHITWKDAATGEAVPVRQTPVNPPPIFRGSRLVSFAILPEGCKACKVALTGSFGDKEYNCEVDVDPATSEHVAGEQIIKLGVRSMIEDIQNGCGGVAASEIKAAVTDLSVKYGVLSKYTAFVAIGSGGESLEASMVARRVTRRPDPPSFSFKFSSSSSAPARSHGLGLFRNRKKSAPQDTLSRLQESRETLEKRNQFLSKKIQQQVGEATRYKSAGNNRMAVVALKRKRLLEEQQRKIASADAEIVRQMSAVQSSQADVTSIMMTGSTCSRNPMAVEKVDRVMDDMQDQAAISQEISDACHGVLPFGEVVDEDELLEELDELDCEDITESACECSCRPKAKPRSAYTEEDELAELESVLLGSCSPRESYSKPAPAAAAPKPAAPKPPKPVDTSKSLDNVIMQQKASGCFNPLALQLLDIPDSAKNARPTALPEGMDAKLAEDVWITLLVLVGLEKKYGDKKSEWIVLAKKSEKWASSKLGAMYDAWKSAAQAAF